MNSLREDLERKHRTAYSHCIFWLCDGYSQRLCGWRSKHRETEACWSLRYNQLKCQALPLLLAYKWPLAHRRCQTTKQSKHGAIWLVRCHIGILVTLVL